MRAFIGLELPDEFIQQIYQAQRFLSAKGIRARWTRLESSHITLTFIPDLEVHKINTAAEALEDAAKQRLAPLLYLTAISGFPKLDKAAIIYLDVNGEIKKLQRLVKNVRRNLERIHIPYDVKPFVPHVTLGRSRRYANLKYLGYTPPDIIQSPVSQLTLFKSELTRTGAIYTRLKTIRLGTKIL